MKKRLLLITATVLYDALLCVASLATSRVKSSMLWFVCSVSQSVSQSVGQSVIQSVSQSVSRSVSHPVSESASQSTNQSVSDLEYGEICLRQNLE